MGNRREQQAGGQKALSRGPCICQRAAGEGLELS